MDKLKMHSVNMVDENIKKIGELFPNCVTERVGENGKIEHAIDFDVLKQELSSVVVEGNDERYQFTWPDKKKSVLLANAPIAKTLRPCKEESVDFDNTENLYIEGDNLDVLKLLQETYLGKIKMIYIDPPYNTGNDFVYEDDFSESAEEYLANSGQFDEQGNKLVANTESNGRFHTDWLNMIYPRLKLAKNLLSDDGVIFISIDENEVSTLKTICDEIFGQFNFIAELIWSAGRKNDSKHISVSHEYILCYFKNASYIQEKKILWRERKQGLDDIYNEYEQLKKQYGVDYEIIEMELKRWFRSLPDSHPAKDHSHYNRVDEKGVYFADNISWPGGGGPKYDVLHPITRKPVKIPSRGWLTNENTMKEWIAQGRVAFGKDENAVPTLKSYLRDREYSVPYSVFYKDGRAASKRLAQLMGDKVFENPKDEEIIQRIIQLCGTDDGDIVLDFFSGSATTAHAIFLANADQKKKRRFILVQLPEPINPKSETSERAKKVAQNAVKLLDSINVPHNICEIGKERIRRAGNKIKAELKERGMQTSLLKNAPEQKYAFRKEGDTSNDSDYIKDPEIVKVKSTGLYDTHEFDEKNKEMADNLDIGFRVLKLDSSNMKDVYYTPDDYTPNLFDDLTDNIKADRSPEDLLFQVMLDLGILLSSKIEETTIAGKKVFSVEDGFLVACFDKDVTDETITAIAKQKPYYFVMRDSSMASDSVAANFEQIFATYSPDTVRKVL